ncbi:MAG TPA: DUF4089 domain-containing protein [Hyphomicrobiaceae bacterium]|nr:DUF4089 domain-containing protein [Hyphomicrobiaceae bacterium]
MSDETDRALESLIAAAAELLALPIEPAWRPAIEANLKATLQLAATVVEFELADDLEPAPVFNA